MKKHLKEQQEMGQAAEKVDARLEKIPGLGQLMQKVTKRDDAAQILAAMAEKLGGDKLKASVALQQGLNIEKKAEKEKQAEPAGAAAQPAPAAGAPAVTAEALRRTAKFVSYLFEAEEAKEEETHEEPKKKEEPKPEPKKLPQAKERKGEIAHSDVETLKRALNRIPVRYFRDIDTAQEAIEVIINGVISRMDMPANEERKFKSQVLRKLIRSSIKDASPEGDEE